MFIPLPHGSRVTPDRQAEASVRRRAHGLHLRTGAHSCLLTPLAHKRRHVVGSGSTPIMVPFPLLLVFLDFSFVLGFAVVYIYISLEFLITYLRTHVL